MATLAAELNYYRQQFYIKTFLSLDKHKASPLLRRCCSALSAFIWPRSPGHMLALSPAFMSHIQPRQGVFLLQQSAPVETAETRRRRGRTAERRTGDSCGQRVDCCC